MLLSVITINLDNANGLGKTISSVLSQSFTDFEYLIIDGGSHDGSVELIRQNQKRIIYWVSEPDDGIYHAMNKGLRKAQGEYLLFLNSGDWLAGNDILEKVFQDENAAEIIYGDIRYHYPDGRTKTNKPLAEDELTLAGFHTNSRETIPHQAAFIRKSLFDNSGYDETYRLIADIKFFIEQIIFRNVSVRYLPYVISNYDAQGITSDPANWAETIREREKIFRELLPPRVLKDYEMIWLIKDSPLLQHMPFLNKTTGFHRLVARVVGLMVWTYQAFSVNKK